MYFYSENRSEKISARSVNIMVMCLLGPLKRFPDHGAVPLKSKVPIEIH